jgi:pyrroline-5-carboxylate reductase
MSFTVFGIGSMGSALARALHKQKIPLQLVGKTKEPPLLKELGIEQKEVIKTDYALLCVKPKDFLALSTHPLLKEIPVIISVMTGITLKTLKKALPHAICIRAMPNIGVQWGVGITIFANTEDLKNHWSFLKPIFEETGQAPLFEEKYFDALTALTGSGPAFIMAVIESIKDAGLEMGLPKDKIESLTLSLFQNTLDILENSQESPKTLIERIRAPGGTTHAGLSKYSQENLKEVFLVAFERAKELS